MSNSLINISDNFSKIKGERVDYIPLKVGNIENKNKFITDINNNTWYIDYQGNAISLGEHLTWRNIAETLINHLDILVELSKKAPIESPELLGNPTSITPLLNNVSDSIATTSYVNNLIDKKLTSSTKANFRVYKSILLSESIEIHINDIMFKVIEEGKIYIKAVNDVSTVFIDKAEYKLNLIYQLIDDIIVGKNESLNYELILDSNVYHVSITNFNNTVLHILIDKYL